MSTGGGKIIDALLAQLTEKKDLYVRLKDDQDKLLAFIEEIGEKITVAQQSTLALSASSTPKTRGLGKVKSLEQEADAARDRLTALEGRMEEIEKEIEEFKELLKG